MEQEIFQKAIDKLLSRESIEKIDYEKCFVSEDGKLMRVTSDGNKDLGDIHGGSISSNHMCKVIHRDAKSEVDLQTNGYLVVWQYGTYREFRLSSVDSYIAGYSNDKSRCFIVSAKDVYEFNFEKFSLKRICDECRHFLASEYETDNASGPLIQTKDKELYIYNYADNGCYYPEKLK